MRKLLIILTAVLLTANVFAQAPQKMSYQAVIRSSSSALVTSANIGMQISILQGSASGTAVYVETQSPTIDTNGMVSIEIGGGTVVSGNFSTINWGNGPYFIKTETDPAGGTNYSITGTSQLLSVPYALHAKTAAIIVGGTASHYIGEPYGGGVIFHLWQDSTGIEHGLVAAITDQDTALTNWSNATSTSYWPMYSSWDGLSNSNAFVAIPGSTSSAAKLCLDLVSGGQSDWYLPAIDQLNLLSSNRVAVNKALMNISGATVLQEKGDYCSSTMDPTNNTRPFFYSFSSNYISPSTGGTYLLCVRAVRTF